MVIKVGINGFGRIGRIIARACLQNSNLQVTAINDPAISAEYICYLLKFDSTHGKLKSCISRTGNVIIIDDKQIKVFHESVPASIPWQTASVQYVVESSGMFTNLEKASGHLANDTVKRVIVTAPSVDIPMVILGVNENTLTAGQKVISCASSTLYCLAPIIKILEDNFGVSEGFITSIHAMTPSLKPLDGLCLRGKHWRDHRSIHQNIIPAATGACKALGKIIPQMKDKLSGLAFRVPIVNVSVLDVSIRLCMNTSLQEIVKTVEKASQFNMANIIKVTSEELVSSDFMGEHCSCMFDGDTSIQLKPNFYKIICWYENEHSYACRVIDSIFFSEKQLFQLEFPSKLTNVRLKSVCKRDEILQTDPDKLQSSVAVHCDFGIVSKNTSSDTNATSAQRSKSSPRQITKKLVAQTGSFPGCKDINTANTNFIKIWHDNDIAKPPVKQNRGSFFQSCTAFSPPILKQISNCAYTQERLDNVKKEFSKMINITEDLLKKTHSSQTQNKVPGKDEFKLNIVSSIVGVDKNKPDEPLKPLANICGDFEDIKINQLQNKSSHKDSLNKLSITSKLNETKESDKAIKSVDLCGDFKDNKKSDIKINQLQNKCSHKDSLNKLSITSKLNERKESDKAIKSVDLCGDFKDSKKSDINPILEAKNKKFNEELKPIQYRKSLQKIKTDEELICFNVDRDVPESGLNNETVIEEVEKENSEMTHSDYDCGDKVSNDTDFDNRLADKVVNTLIDSFHQTYQVQCASLISKEKIFIKNEPETDQNDTKQPQKTDFSNHTQFKIENESLKSGNETNLCNRFKGFANVKFIDEELKKRNIVLVDNPFIDETDSGVSTNQSPRPKPTESQREEDLCKEMLEELDAFPSETIVSSCSKNIVFPTNYEYNKKQDIYDKLDSASGSDSDNSFDIHDKKSQIIHITDLTNSLEDLARLDKICKIIEISDELSDKLFSPLNNADGASLKKERWSFKDLCDRIKLDEFCNKVFGHRTM